LKPADLELVSPDHARSITVMSPKDDAADIQVIKVLLLLRYREWVGPRRPHVVAAVQDSHNYSAAVLAGGGNAQIIDADDIAVRLVVQSHRQSGLSTVCTDLLDFSGNEIYMAPPRNLAGATFGDALNGFDKACPIGIYARASDTIAINPPMCRVIEPTDELIVIAETRSDARPSPHIAAVEESAIVSADDAPIGPDQTLLIGWNTRAPKIIQLLDDLVGYGSHVDIAVSRSPNSRSARAPTSRSGTRRATRPAVPRSRVCSWTGTATSLSSPMTASARPSPTTGRWSRCCTYATSRSATATSTRS
jgi:hypothetical protein